VKIGTWGTWGGARPSRTALAFLVALVLASCGGSPESEPDAVASSRTPTSTVADPSQLSVAGEYPTEVELKDSSCQGIVVEPTTTTVQQEPGDTELTLTHAGLTYHGTLAPDASFSTSPESVVVGDARHTLTIVGRFSTTGFTARVDAAVEQDHAPRTCQYAVTWVGTKDGDPNTVPAQ
jgi:hypothetical protein